MKKGLVLKSTGKWYDVISNEGKHYICQVRGKLRLKDIVTTNPVAAGDIVEFDTDDEDLKGSIIAIQERKNYIIRRSVNLSKEAQIVAANIDTAFLFVTTTRPQTTPGFIDRFLVTAEAYSVPVIVVFSKIDHYAEKELDALAAMIDIYSGIGYQCMQVSVENNIGIDELKAAMKDGINLFSGHSGTGKSSMINLLIPGMDLRTGEISEASNKGQHTTTFAEMHPLTEGGYVIDTPGIKGFGLIDIPKEELHHYFREFFELLPQCRFGNCKHLNEPGCAVHSALEKGEIPSTRYDSYLSMWGDEEERSPYR